MLNIRLALNIQTLVLAIVNGTNAKRNSFPWAYTDLVSSKLIIASLLFFEYLRGKINRKDKI